LNLIVDLDPFSFLETGMASFTRQVDVVDHLNLFISNLQNYDVTQSRFPVPPWFRQKTKYDREHSKFDFTTKVNQVCLKARKVMQEIESAKDKPERYYLLPILSTFAKEQPPNLEEALRLIKDDALKQHPKNSPKNPLFAEAAQHSIQYLAFLAEYELLFETSLGIYDFEIARAVARNSQMDPKVYLPLLQRLNTLPTFYSRYEVDLRLKRFDKALRNLYKSYVHAENLDAFSQTQNGSFSGGNSFENCMSLINQHELHQLGLELFRDDTERVRIILIALADSLMKQSRPKMALPVYLSASPPDVEGARRAAKAARDWRCYFCLLERDGETTAAADKEFLAEKRRQAARDIAREMTSSVFSDQSKRQIYSDAARILVDYGDDLIGAVDNLVQAECWSEGHRIATLYSRQDLAKRCMDGAIAFAHTSIENFGDRSAEFENANRKYDEVLKLRKQNIHSEGPELVSEAVETGSLFSAASTSSNMSLRSSTSTSSTGSGVSSVISIKSSTTFQMKGIEAPHDRHRSKFNKGKKKKQQKNKRKSKQKPGSEEELQGLVGLLKTTCPNTEYADTISQTIHFLIFLQNLSLAKELFAAYVRMCSEIDKFRLERMASHAKEKAEAELLTRTQGDQHELSHLLVDLPVEKEVDELHCAKLDPTLSEFFDLLHANQ